MMKLCFPVSHNEGLSSLVCDHFGKAPLMLVVDTESEQIHELKVSRNLQTHGSCYNPEIFKNMKVDSMILSSAGYRTLAGLEQAGIQVLQARGATIADNLLCLEDNRLGPLSV